MIKIFLCLLFFSVAVFPQEKFLIYFKDKGFTPGDNSAEEVQAYSEARNHLSAKAVERRKRITSGAIIDEKDLPVHSGYVRELENMGAVIVHKLRWFNSVSAYIPGASIERIADLNFVEKIEPVRSVKISEPVKNEYNSFPVFKYAVRHKLDYGPSFTQLELSDIPLLHDRGITGGGVRIGIMDTGFDWKEQKSTKDAKIIAERDFVFNDNITANGPDDIPSQHVHGTLVLSTIAGKDEGNLIGAAFDAEFVLAKTEDIRSETHAEEDNYAAALEWFESLGVDVATSSLGYNEFDPSETSYTYEDMNGKTAIVTRAAEIAFQKGMVTVTSAGNEGNSDWFFITAPGDGFNTITVGAVNSGNQVASFSSRGPTSDGRIKPDVCAMGVTVLAADARTKDYAYFSGTSLSAPLTAGICALVLSEFPYLTNRQLRQIIIESGDNVKSPDNERGFGLLSALRAVTFPHIKNFNGKSYLVKEFYSPKGIDNSEIFLNITASSGNLNVSAAADTNGIVEFLLPDSLLNDDISFTYSYKDSTGKWIKEPSVAAYSKSSGDILIKRYAGEVIYSFIPDKFKLSNAYPNPFNNSTALQFELPSPVEVTVKLYDILGREVRNFIDTKLSEGYYKRIFNLAGMSSGVYLLKFQAGNNFEIRKLVLIK